MDRADDQEWEDSYEDPEDVEYEARKLEHKREQQRLEAERKALEAELATMHKITDYFVATEKDTPGP
jgi:hypothetical protein